MRAPYDSLRFRLFGLAGVWVLVGLAVAGLLIAEVFRFHLTEQFRGDLTLKAKKHADALPFHLATGAAAVAVLAALWWRRYHLARVAVGAQVSLIIWGWALAQYPFLIPPDLTVDGAAAPEVTLRLVLIALGLGTAILLPSLVYLFRVFKAAPSDSARRLPKGGPAS